MITEDFEIGQDWFPIPLRTNGTFVAIVDTRRSNILYKIGSEISESIGIKYKDGDTVKVAAPIQIKSSTNKDALVTIVRD